ncbi:hypothetical protein [Dactylosporangium matsuzakiense]|uniref:hypothetical protein n=1 Tax=Dactylosporangium matsuzakiense TaxID=53360 RepID=UPI0022F336A1|nr:hypothetical protein [Dactylosporangium matsuzakiense]
MTVDGLITGGALVHTDDHQPGMLLDAPDAAIGDRITMLVAEVDHVQGRFNGRPATPQPPAPPCA